VVLVNKVDQLMAELEATTVELEATKRREKRFSPVWKI
jgi:hypothetical protein